MCRFLHWDLLFRADTAAANAGGITRMILMPDQSPPLDEPALVAFAQGSGKPDVWVHPLAAATRGLRGDELAEIGLAGHWLEIAQIVGYDHFIAIWRLLSADPALRNDDSQIELCLRPFRSYERYQRNRYIDTLVTAGLRPSLIIDMVRQDLGETLSPRHIRRLAARGRVHAGKDESQPASPPWRSGSPDTVQR